jgi:hypothetical protein
VREGSGFFYDTSRSFYQRLRKYFDSDIDVEIEPAELGFSLCFRHDMDNFDAGNFADFLSLEESIDAPSTLFFMQRQFAVFPEQIKKLDSAKYECALHSEAKTTPIGWSLHQASRLLERGYARRLRKQAGSFARALGEPLGHSAHAVNNYLPFQGWINWNIIENATLRAGMAYISDWRLPARTAEGEEFQPPWPAYWRRRDQSRLLVLPTCWDDKYFLYSYEDLHIRKIAPTDRPYKPGGIEAAWDSFLRQAEHCRALNTPAIVNIHPWHSACNGHDNFYALKRRIVDWCRRENVPIKQCRDYLKAGAVHKDEQSV